MRDRTGFALAATVAAGGAALPFTRADAPNATQHSPLHAEVQGEALEGRMNITIDGRSMTLAHWPYSVRGLDFRVWAQIDAGSLVEIEPGQARTIRGTIEELPGSIVAGSLLDDGLHAGVFLPDGRQLWIEPAERRGDGVDIADARGHVLAHGVRADISAPRRAPAEDSEPMRSMECEVAQIAFDADYHMYVNHNSSEQDVTDRIEAILNANNVQYESEVGIIHEISEIVIRTSAAQNPYTSNNASMLLQQFRSVWNSPPEESVERHIAHLYTGRVLDGGVTGIAFLSVVCDVPNAYAVLRDLTIDFSCVTDLAARTLGLNWGASVCDCPGTTMHMTLSCANTFIGPGSNSVDEILAYKDSVDCLEPCAPECQPADLNCDGSVGVADLLILLAEWGPCDDPQDCPADLDGDGQVGVADLLILLANWG